MFTAIDTRHCHAVEQEVKAIHAVLFPQADAQLVPRAFGWATTCFTGQYPGYQAIDAAYHDFEHTLQGTLCLTRLLQGYSQAEAVPTLTPKMFELALLASCSTTPAISKPRTIARAPAPSTR